MASTLASLCSLVIFAERVSQQRAQRIPGTLFAAMLMPIPVVQITMPFSHVPSATAFATAGQIYITQLVGAGRKGQTKETVSTLLTLIFVIPFGCPGVMLFGYRQIWQF